MAITADNTVAMKGKLLPVDGMKCDYEVAATTVIYKWSFVGLNATGYLTSYVAPAAGAALTGTRFVGIALEHIKSQTSDGDARCSVLIDGYFEYTLASTDRVDIGTPVFASDNSTLVMDGCSGNCVGYIVAWPGTSLAMVKLLGPTAQQAGHLLTVTSPAVDYATDAQQVLLVHETQNPNGLLLCTCTGYSTEAHMCATTAGVITIYHTATTSMGCTLTAVDNSAALDSVVGVGGQLWAPASATDDAIVVAPAGKRVLAKVSTQSDEGANETGQIKIFATFMCL